MNTLVVMFLVMIIFFLPGCDNKGQNGKSTGATPTVKDEMTKLGEIPSILGEGLSPEEKAELKDQILPPGMGDFQTAAEEKFKALLESAKAGDPAAQNGLGVMYYTGEAISKGPSGQMLNNDPELAAGWFFRAAEQGYADAQFNLGLMHANGESVEKDMLKAAELFKKAADQGHVDAQNNLGVMYFTGEGVERDEKKAVMWFEKAAAQGNADAQANLDAIKSAGK